MSETEFLAIINAEEENAVAYNGEFMRENEKFLEYYFANPFGDERTDQSSVISTDVADVVESDMPSHARVFLGKDNIMEFTANNTRQVDVIEAEQKTAYINWIIKHQPTSYKVLYDWIKDAEIQKMGVVRYDYEELKEVNEEVYEGLSDQEQIQLISDLIDEEAREKNTDIKILEKSGEPDNNTLKFRVTRQSNKFNIKNIPTENFLITRNAISKEDAILIGDRCPVTKSTLIQMGYDEETVKGLPVSDDNNTSNSLSTMNYIRNQDQGYTILNNSTHWTNQKVMLSNLYVKVDYDNDGIAERRHILKVGSEILENEPFKIAPYAFMSAIGIPHKAIGRSRAEITIQAQRVNSVLTRQILDNIYRVNNGRVVTNDDETNIDDLLVVRQNGIVRTKGRPLEAVAQLSTPYIGDKALQVVQYMDSKRAQTTGTYLANQGLGSDSLYNETATRFRGTKQTGDEKVELVARNYAETGFRDLYEGLAWMVGHYQNEDVEMEVLGSQLTFNPAMWRGNHTLVSNVGLAAGDDDNVMNSMSALLTIDQQLKANGSVIVDDKKIYNKIAKLAESMGFQNIKELYNDPELPQETLLAQHEQLLTLAEQQKQEIANLQNPLADAETIKAKASLIKAQAQQDLDIAKLQEQMRQFNARLQEDKRQYNGDLAVDLTKLEADTNKDINGSLI